MKQIIYKAALLLGILICLFGIPLCVRAETDEPDAATLSETGPEDPASGVISEAVPEQENTIALPDSTDLAEGYINQQFNGGAAAVPRLKARRITQGSKLTGVNLTAYQLILEAVTEIAAGGRTSTELQLSRDALGISLKYYYAADLSVTNVIGPDGQPTAEAKAAMNRIIGFNIKTVMDALTADYPYEFYWFDKTKGYVHSSCSYGTSASGDFICFPKVYNLRMSVAPAYAYESERYIINTEETGRAKQAAENAGNIIASEASLEDREKLSAYKDIICELTSYDKTVSASGTYGDPWQMVYVFDNDPETNVVCEGYAKAFQYLCDNSDFSDPSVVCNTVTGSIQGVVSNGLHMWNLVTIAGENYHADITNSDTGTAGSRGQLFLAAVDCENMYWQDEAGGILSEYRFTSPRLQYKYDADTMALYTKDELKVADTGHEYEFSSWQWLPDPSGIGYTVKAVLTCSRCQRTKLIDAEVAVETTEATETEEAMLHYTAVASYGDQTFKDERTDAVAEEKEPDTEQQPAEKQAEEADPASAGDTDGKTGEASASEAEDAAGHITLEAAEKQITALQNDGDLINTNFRTLAARVTSVKKTSLTVKWKRVKGAAGYIIYAAKAGASRYVRAGETGNSAAKSFTLKKISGKRLKKNTYYKILILAYKNSTDGRRLLASSKTIHAATGGGKNGNPVKLTGLKTSLAVQRGKKIKLSVKQPADAGKKIKKYRAVSFESTDPSIAAVSKKGMIKAKKKGNCLIYVYAQNGLSKKIKIKVK